MEVSRQSRAGTLRPIVELIFRWAEPEDVFRIKEFIADNFGADSIQAAPGRFEALFLEHPLGFHIALCVSGDEIAGIRCYLPARLRSGKKIYSAAFPIDLMVNPRYRRRGISRRFLDMAQDRFQLTVSSGQSPAQAAMYKKSGAAVVAVYRIGYLIRRPALQSTIRATLRDGLAWSRWYGKRRLSATMKDLAEFNEADLANLTVRGLADDEVGNAVDHGIFRWRYTGSFYNDCKTGLIECENERGLVVYKHTGAETKILDIFCRAEATGLLIKAVAACLPGRRLTVKFAGTRLASRFSEAGFLVRPMDARVTVYSTNRTLQTQVSNRQWVIFAGDSDTELLDFPRAGAGNELC